MLWTVGYRGLNDYPFWKDEPGFDTDAERGALISKAIEAQVAVVKEFNSSHNGGGKTNPEFNSSHDGGGKTSRPEFFTYLWSEMTRLFVHGHLKVPDGVTVVHADNGNGFVQPADLKLTKAQDGLYLHVAVEGGANNQLTEAVPPRRLFETLGGFVKRNATRICIVNLSDLKNYPMGIRAALDFLWDPAPHMAAGTPLEAEAAFLKQWLTRQYGEAAAPKLLPIVQAYFSTPFITDDAETSTGEGSLSQSLRAHAEGTAIDTAAPPRAAAPRLVGSKPRPGPWATPDAVAQLERTYSRAQAALQAIPLDRQGFWRSHTLLQAATWYRTVAAMANVSDCDAAVKKGDHAAAAASARAALGHIQALLVEQQASEGSKWAGWHLHDWLDGNANLRDVMRRLVARVDAKVAGVELPTPPLRPWRFGTGGWNSFFNYESSAPKDSASQPTHMGNDDSFPFFQQPQLVQHKDGSVATPDNSLAGAVRFACSGGGCAEASGAHSVWRFTGNASVTLSVVGGDGGQGTVIRYAMDGGNCTATPSVDSTLCEKKCSVCPCVEVASSVCIAAAAFDAATNVSMGPVTRVLFQKN